MKILPGAAVAASILCAHPASASPALDPESLAPAYAVDQFNDQRGGQAVWLMSGTNSASVQALLMVLRRAPLDGFASGPELADVAQAALGRAAGGDPVAVRSADKLLSSAWVMYVQALHWPSAGMIYADPALAPRIPAPASVLADLADASSPADHVIRVSAINPIYSALRDAAAANRDPVLAATLRANLDRARAIPGRGRFVLVDLASQKLWMMDGGQMVDSMRVVVGKSEMPTPLLAGTIRTAILNPYWNVPGDLVRKNIAPAASKGGEAYLATKGYQLLSGWEEDAMVVDPTTVDWSKVASGARDLRVRQRPGAANMMGAMKFEFPNASGIYLHDTPNKSLFAKATRTLSSGCIRLEDAPRLGRWLLGREPVASGSAPEQTVTLPAAVPVYITYLTARPENGQIAMSVDIYGLDLKANSKLAAR